ncbi:hypothetical protein [Caulobacter sp. DWP3-1-3b2]|uniref:hypothetical protein n=1 Tax=unclassified Caulobacter TaxID=2648921 RepID=UPI003CF55C16
MRARAVLLGLALSALATAAHAERKMYSFDPISADAKRLTGAGLTVLFDRKLTGTRVLKVLATGVPVQARLIGGHQKDLAPGGLKAMAGVDADADLYEIDPKFEQGRVYIRAFCPGAKRLWLSFSRLATYRDLRVQAFGDDPKGGATRVCGTLDFSFRGEWKLPNGKGPDPMDDWADDKGPG